MLCAMYYFLPKPSWLHCTQFVCADVDAADMSNLNRSHCHGSVETGRVIALGCTLSGVKIEVSLAKDQSLNFLVSGKHDAVMKARKLIVQLLQTTVGIFTILLYANYTTKMV